MKKFTLFLLIVISISVFAQKKTENNALSQNRFTPKSMGYKLVWEDQFNGNSLDTNKWNVRGVGPRRIGYNSASAVKVEGGMLKLFALQKGDSILGSAIGSAKHFNPRYGYFECRAQLQKSIGIWAAFWLQSPEIFKGEDPSKFGTEMDIFEFFREMGNDTITHALHWAYGPHMKSVGPLKSYLKGLSDGFHTFGFEWTPETLKSLEKTVFPDVFLVDWVKVYQKKQTN